MLRSASARTRWGTDLLRASEQVGAGHLRHGLAEAERVGRRERERETTFFGGMFPPQQQMYCVDGAGLLRESAKAPGRTAEGGAREGGEGKRNAAAPLGERRRHKLPNRSDCDQPGPNCEHRQPHRVAPAPLRPFFFLEERDELRNAHTPGSDGRPSPCAACKNARQRKASCPLYEATTPPWRGCGPLDVRHTCRFARHAMQPT